MAFYDSPLRRRAARAVDAVLVLLMSLLVVQVWLLMACVELWLAGHRGRGAPAAVVSGLLFAAGIGLMMLVRRTERSAGGASSLSSNAATRRHLRANPRAVGRTEDCGGRRKHVVIFQVDVALVQLCKAGELDGEFRRFPG